jgi:beta-galactosidase
MLLDYRLFRADSIGAFVEEQVRIIRNGSAAQITTNSPGGVWGKAMDSNLVFKDMDFVGYDNYPVWGGSLTITPPSQVAMALALARGWAPPGQGSNGSHGFMIVEQLIGTQVAPK